MIDNITGATGSNTGSIRQRCSLMVTVPESITSDTECILDDISVSRSENIMEQDPDIELWEPWTPPTQTVPPRTKKSVQHIGDKLERTSAARRELRKNQTVEVLKAFIDSDLGFTDQELSAGAIGGADGARRRRYLRSEWALDFNVRKDSVTGLKRYSLADKEHAKKTLAVGGKVDPLL